MRTSLLLSALAISVCATPVLADPLIILRKGQPRSEISAEASPDRSPISRGDSLPEAEAAKEAAPVAVEPRAEVPPAVNVQNVPRPAGRRAPSTWLEASALSWRISDGPLPLAIVTRGDSADALPGALGQAGTRVAFGGRGLDYGQLGGLRLTAGAWLDNEPIGVEISAFALNQGSTSFAVRSDMNGSPGIYMPAFNVMTGAEGSLIVADPVLGYAGGVSVQSESRLHGWEANALFAAVRAEWGDVDLLVGYRSMSLQEKLAIRNQSSDLIRGTFTDIADFFQTDNQFDGGQVGLRATRYHGNWFASVAGKIAFGPTRGSVTTNGVNRSTTPAAFFEAAPPPLPNGTFAGGFFNQPSNTGSQTQYEWSTVSELNLRVGCDAWDCVRAFVGFDLLCWNTVARPGDQIDRALNLTQSQVFGGGALIGPQRPTSIFQTTDFLASGVSAGIELRY